MKITYLLQNLAKIFDTPLYVVGGAVRDSLCGYQVKDVDLAADKSPDEVKQMLSGTRYRAVFTSPKFGTLKIMCGRESWEYTTFRTDSYAGDGSHRPLEVKFTSDLVKDALRRDFRCNAVYYDIIAARYVDPLEGLEDISKRIMRATRPPEEVFSEDGLRVMRLVRIAAETGFTIDEETLEGAKNKVDTLAEIAPCRKRDEFTKMLIADTANGIKGAQRRALELMTSIGAMRYIAPEIYEGIGFAQRPDFHRYDVFGHIMKVVELCPPEVRLAAFFHDIAKPEMRMTTGKSAGHAERGAEIAETRMRAMCYSNAEISEVCALVRAHMFDLKCNASESDVRRFIQINHKYIGDLLKLKDADHLGSGIMTGRNPSGIRLEKVFEEMKNEGVPMTVKELKVGGEDLITLKIPEELRAEAVKSLLAATADGGELLKRENQLKYLENFK